MSSEWISSAEAARRLGVSAATLYAYVSRGLLRSEGTNGRRERRYRADDVSRLKRRRSVGRKAEAIAAHALDCGTPGLACRAPSRRAPVCRAALVRAADHEFSASRFAARVVASTGTHLYGSTMAGLAAINGPRHGGMTRQVAGLFAELGKNGEIGGE